MISMPGHREPRRRQRGALPAWLPSGQNASRAASETIPLLYLMTAQAVARARWRRCFALSLAFRLLARIVLLDLAIFFTWGSDLDGIGPFLSGILIARHRLSAG